MMRLHYIGHSTVRLVEQHRWDKTNGFICDVLDATLAITLLTEPDGAFVIAQAEPLLALPDLGEPHAALLALCGVASLDQLAQLSQAEGARIAAAMSVSERQVAAWVLAARNKLDLDSAPRKRASKPQEVEL